MVDVHRADAALQPAGSLTVTRVPLASGENGCLGHRLTTGMAECLATELKRTMQLVYGRLPGMASSWQGESEHEQHERTR